MALVNRLWISRVISILYLYFLYTNRFVFDCFRLWIFLKKKVVFNSSTKRVSILRVTRSCLCIHLSTLLLSFSHKSFHFNAYLTIKICALLTTTHDKIMKVMLKDEISTSPTPLHTSSATSYCLKSSPVFLIPNHLYLTTLSSWIAQPYQRRYCFPKMFTNHQVFLEAISNIKERKTIKIIEK